mmetsp:Transcript_81623/g.95188  ORF Transcript_81623/g.95188 Transcript_81623/m.95188 type:complete len:232 (-) Transcript_81623:42-737(-)
MDREDDRAAFACELIEQGDDLRRRDGVESRRRLVQQQHLGVRDQLDANVAALALAARQTGDKPGDADDGVAAVVQMQLHQRFLHALHRRLLVGTSTDAQREAERAGRRRQRRDHVVLRHKPKHLAEVAVVRNLAQLARSRQLQVAVRREAVAQRVQERRLSGSARAHDCQGARGQSRPSEPAQNLAFTGGVLELRPRDWEAELVSKRRRRRHGRHLRQRVFVLHDGGGHLF